MPLPLPRCLPAPQLTAPTGALTTLRRRVIAVQCDTRDVYAIFKSFFLAAFRYNNCRQCDVVFNFIMSDSRWPSWWTVCERDWQQLWLQLPLQRAVIRHLKGGRQLMGAGLRRGGSLRATQLGLICYRWHIIAACWWHVVAIAFCWMQHLVRTARACSFPGALFMSSALPIWVSACSVQRVEVQPDGSFVCLQARLFVASTRRKAASASG